MVKLNKTPLREGLTLKSEKDYQGGEIFKLLMDDCYHKCYICVYDDFTENSLHNQVLKSAMLLLLRHGDVKTDNKMLLRKLLMYFAKVSDIHPMEIRWDMLKYHRNNASYRMLIEICHLTVRGLLLTTEAGVHKLASWINDEKMYQLYERFVLAYYKQHHSDWSPSASYIDWDVSDAEKSVFLPTMKSDVILSKGDKTIIIDAKYYGRTMQTNYERETYRSRDLYQIYAYVMNRKNRKLGSVAGVLLYAKTDEINTPNEDMVISGNQISLKTQDLNTSFSSISRQLDNIVECSYDQAVGN